MSTLSDYLALTKPGVVWLIILSTAVGFYMGMSGSLPLVLLMHTLAATALLAGGTGALNQWMERDLDACMRRTEKRPLPAGRLKPFPALLFGTVLVLAGLLYLALAVNALTALLGLLTTAGYLFIYTPLKTRTPLSTFLGSFPGAMPPLIGWVAAQNELELGGWALFLVLFFWQFPHFYAIAWMYREDYAKAGVLMLPVVKPDGVAVGHRIILYAALLLPVSLTPVLLGMTGAIYLVGAGICSFGYFVFGLFAARRKTTYHARRLLQASVVYLPLIYFLLVFDKVP
ncbi:MAG: protoheme IX farnesyltransferase [Solibacterales bacterium]|nr:protoheme IX farnesyltransferase [Bryobacterales bacterium]|tara:strand:- start:3868 stop:4725 length:858 start_codon:yes stop_codon:yes gene_type:complete